MVRFICLNEAGVKEVCFSSSGSRNVATMDTWRIPSGCICVNQDHHPGYFFVVQVCLGVWHGVSWMLIMVVQTSQAQQRDFSVRNRIPSPTLMYFGALALEETEPRHGVTDCTFKYHRRYMMRTV